MQRSRLPTSAPVESPGWIERGKEGVLLWEVLDLEGASAVTFRIESTRSRFEQGIWISSDSGIRVDGVVHPSIHVRQSTWPSTFPVEVGPGAKQLHFYNTWFHEGQSRSQSYSSGMVKDVVSGRIRYSCNDVGFDGTFCSLVFPVDLST